MKNTPAPSPEELVIQARQCLENNEAEIERIADIPGRGTYNEARCTVLMKDLGIDQKEAQRLLRSLDALSTKITDVKDAVATTIEQPSCHAIIEEFMRSYHTFCEENELSPATPPESELAKEIVYWFKDIQGEQHSISVGQAYALLYGDPFNITYLDYIERMYNRTLPETSDKQSD